EPVPTGKVSLRMVFKTTGSPDFKMGKGARGVAALFINDEDGGTGKIPRTTPLAYSLSGDGLSIGRDTLSSVSLDYAGSTFPFMGGTIHRVTVDIGNDQPKMPKLPERD